MSNKKYAPVCGIYCGNCTILGRLCEGCCHVDGKPFWTSWITSGVCPLHDCCRNRMQLEHCGLCEQFPCSTFIVVPNPGMNGEEFRISLGKRQEALRRRAEIGTDKWLLELFDS